MSHSYDSMVVPISKEEHIHLNQYEKLLQNANDKGAEVIDYAFENDTIKGLYCDNTIAINKNIKTTAEKGCILAEELGHYYTSTGNILDQNLVENRKQEQRARLWAYRKMVTLEKIMSACEAGCRNRYELAEHLDVTEEFLQEALDKYHSIYGVAVQVGDYLMMFEPLNIYRLSDYPTKTDNSGNY